MAKKFMENEESVLRWMDKAIEMVKPYLPEDYEIDDCQWGEGCFQFDVIDCTDIRFDRSYGCTDRFRFFRHESETDAENEERFFEEVQEFVDSWR